MSFTGSNWGRRVLLTGLTPSASLTGFVALVSLDNIPVEAIDGGSNSALNGGGDLRFSTDDAGVNQLPLEVVSYVTDSVVGNRSCQLWVRFPDYASGTREVYMFYGKAGEVQPAVTASFGRNEVWQDRAAAWYFNTLPDNSTADIIDVTGNENNGTGTGFVSGDLINGLNGKALDFNTNKITIPDSVDVGISDSGFTLTLLVNVTALTSDGTIFGKGGGWGREYMLDVNDAVNLRLFGDNGSINTQADFYSLGLALGDWDVYVWRLESGSSALAEIIVNNSSLLSSSSSSSLYTNIEDLIFGAEGSGDYFDGNIERAEIRKFPASNDIISSEYDNQSSPATFWITGTPENTGGTPSTFKPFWARNIINNQLLGA